ncbi:MAG: RibD family protein [Hyphomicrobium sp.]
MLTPSQTSAYDAIFAPFDAAPADRPFVVAQLGQSLDGRIATLTGASRWINGAAAIDHLHRLRASVDAVVVGRGTVVADDPLLTVRRVTGRNPARVVIDPDGHASPDARIFAADGARRIIIRRAVGAAPAGVDTLVVAPRAEGMSPSDIIRGLFDLGLRKILIEGGATTVSRFIDARAVDRLHVLVSPMILGSGVTGLSLAAISGLDGALRPQARAHILDGRDVLFDCDLRQLSKG